MASSKPFLGEGSSINRPPSFTVECYDFWKIRMKIFIESQDMDILNAIESGPFIPTVVVNGEEQLKVIANWTDEDKKKVQYDLKSKNILTSALGMDEFFRVSTCTSAKEIWDTLQVTHEGTEEVKRSRMSTLSQEYEMFIMKPGETILEVQKRFTLLTNHLIALGKKFTNDELNLKVLRSLTRAWQPKVTAISEKNSLSKMTLAALFGKLQEHELELGRLEQSEEHDKKKRNISLKAKANEDEDTQSDDSQQEEDDENIALLVKKFGKFLRRNRMRKSTPFKKFPKKNDGPSSSNTTNYTCFESGKQGHIKVDCPQLQKKNSFNTFKGKKDKKPRRAYIAWEDNELSSTSSSDNEDQVANLSLMASHNSDEEVSDDNSTSKPSYDELQNAFGELHEECVRLARLVAQQKSAITFLEHRNKMVVNELDQYKLKFDLHSTCMKCDNCPILESKVDELTKKFSNYEQGTSNLNDMLSKQRYANDRSGLGFSKFATPSKSTSKTTFVPSTSKHDTRKTFAPPLKYNAKKVSYVPSKVSLKPHACFYCGEIGHTPNDCYARLYGVPNGELVWRKKTPTHVTNPKGSKEFWRPRNYY